MRFDRISLRNFVCYPKAEIDLSGARLVVIQGDNGGGKTAVLDALRALLTGDARGLLKKESGVLGMDPERPWRAEAAVVFPDSDVPVTLRRTATTLKAVGEAVKQGDIYAMLKADERQVVRALHLEGAWRTKPAELRWAVLDLMGLLPDGDLLRERGLTEKALVKLALEGEWKKAKKMAADSRKALEKDLDDHAATKPEEPVVHLGGKETSAGKVTAETLAEIEKRIAGARRRIHQLEGASAQQEARREGGLHALQSLLTSKRSDLERVGVDQLEESIESHEKSIAAERSAEAKSRSAMRELLEKNDAVAKKATELRSTIQQAERAEASHECPICGDEHAAASDPERVQEARTMLGKVERALVALKEKHEALAREMQGHEERIRKAFGSIESLRGRIAAAESLRKEVEALEARVSAAESAPADTPQDEEAGAREVEALTKKIAGAETAVRAVREYREALARFEESRTQREELAGRIGELLRQEKLCGPDGLPAELVQPGVVEVQFRFDWWHEQGVLPWPVRVESDFTLHAMQGERWAPVSMLSGSERWRVSLVLCAALAELSGIRFLAVDEADALTPPWRRKLLGALMKLSQSFDQIIVTQAAHEKPQRGPSNEAVQLFWAEGGSIERIPAAEAARA